MKKRLTVLFIGLMLCVCAVLQVSASGTAEQTPGETAKAMVFPADGSTHTAICPVCGKSVSWYALSTASVESGKTLSKGYHYYLSEDIDISLADKSLISAASSTGSKCCLHLNGKKLINRANTALMGSGSRFNVMGDGIVQGSVTDEDKGATIQINTSSPSGAVVLYGGTYSKVNSADTTNVIAVRGNGGIIELHDGATIQSGTGGSAVYLNGEVVYTGAIFRMYGGKLDATASTETAIDMEACPDNMEGKVEFYMYGGLLEGGTGSSGGNVLIRKNGEMHMYGGTIKDGKAANGGNVYVGQYAKFYMYGGTISGSRDASGNPLGGYATTNGGNIFVGNYAQFHMTGGTVENGTADGEGGNIFAKGTGFDFVQLSLENATVQGGKSGSHGGNISIQRAELTIGEGAQILSGTAGGRAGSIRAYVGKIIMTGGKIAGGTAGHSDNSDNLWLAGAGSGTNARMYMYMLGGVIEPTDDAQTTGASVAGHAWLYLGGNATFTDKSRQYAAICVGTNGKLLVCDGWYGSADVYFPSGYAAGSAVSTTYGQVVTLSDDLTATTGGSFTGSLTQCYKATGQFAADSDGKLVAVSALLVDAQGKLTATTDPLTDWENGSYAYIKLCGDQSIGDLGGKEICVDLNGYDLTVGGSGTVNAFDSRNDGYNAAFCGKITIKDSVQLTQEVVAPNGNRYIALTESGKTTMHRLEMRMTAVTLRTTQAGMYYKATYNCDAEVEAKVAAFGIVLSINNMPGADFLLDAEAEDNNCYTLSTEGFKSGVVVTSGSVFNIMKTEREEASNDAYGKCPIYANPYIRLSTDAIFVGDTENAGKTVADADFDGVACSLQDAMAKMDGIFYHYDLSARNRINNFYETWQSKGMNWQFVNIGVKAVSADNSNLSFAAGTTNAVCPVCLTEVTWKPVTQAAYGTTRLGNLSGGDHYYLTEDITYTVADASFLRAPGTGKTACLHLNGFDLTATNNTVITGYAGTINVMGNGTVSGNITSENQGAAVHINTGGANGTVNLYGGTYTKPVTNTAASVIAIWQNGGKINLYEGAQVKGSGAGNAVYVHEAALVNAELGLHGAKVSGGSLYMAVPDTEAGNTSTLNITGNTYIEDAIIKSMYVKLNISGAPVIDRLAMAVNNQLNIGALSDGTDIKVSTRSVFTQPNENMAQYAKYFQPWAATDALVVTEDNTLRYDINYELYMTPYEYDVSAKAIADGKIHYYFMAGAGMVMSPTAEDNVYKWGDSCLIVFPNGEEMLIDSGYAVQAPVLAGSLKRMGVGTEENPLDYLLITHPHNDHVGGAFGSGSTFMDEIKVEMVYHSGINHNGTGANATAVETACTTRGIPSVILEQGMELDFGDVHVQVLWPVAGTSETTVSSGDINDQSMVFRIDYGEHSALFTADLYTTGEANLMASVGTEILDVDLLKVPHHGWNTSSSADFVKAVKPELAVYTGGMMMDNTRQNRYLGQGTTLLCDLLHGYIHVEADTAGEMTYETSQ